MKKLTLILFSFLFIAASGFAQDDKSKRKSPPMTAEGKVGDVSIVIDYGSPKVNGRTIYGELVAYDKVWRAGANEATTINISKDLKIEGEILKAGKYALFVTPKQDDKWEVIFNTQAEQWGAYNRDAAKDALKVNASTSEIKSSESLTYSIDSDGMIHLDWSTTRMTLNVQP